MPSFLNILSQLLISFLKSLLKIFDGDYFLSNLFDLSMGAASCKSFANDKVVTIVNKVVIMIFILSS